MRCPLKTGEGTEIFIAHSARCLAPDAEALLREHLLLCEGCRRVVEAQDQVWSALDAWLPEPVSSNFDNALYARIAAESALPWWSRIFAGSLHWSWKPAMPVAAACAALLGAFLLKSPIPEHQAQASVLPKVDIEQVERALDDIDMLKQLGVSVTAPGAPAHSQSM